ncbi:MAG: HAD family phosphatase [Candidatus Tectomicrobia bacterium]|nr:HAD family phosphatase [Candidatus Tectomicrobia bacterium]
MLEAVIFDFNGVIIDDEGVHCELFQELLAERGFTLSRQEYDERYLAYDDAACFRRMFADRGRSLSEAELRELLARKSRRYHTRLGSGMVIFPGAVELVRRCAEVYPLALGSGARRDEIEAVLKHLSLLACFTCIVSADEVAESKPQPETYTTALRLLNAARGARESSIPPSHCLVIEDTPGGVAAARAAGMRCLAVTHSVPAAHLRAADAVVETLRGLDLALLRVVGQAGSVPPGAWSLSDE